MNTCRLSFFKDFFFSFTVVTVVLPTLKRLPDFCSRDRKQQLLAAIHVSESRARIVGTRGPARVHAQYGWEPDQAVGIGSQFNSEQGQQYDRGGIHPVHQENQGGWVGFIRHVRKAKQKLQYKTEINRSDIPLIKKDILYWAQDFAFVLQINVAFLRPVQRNWRVLCFCLVRPASVRPGGKKKIRSKNTF